MKKLVSLTIVLSLLLLPVSGQAYAAAIQSSASSPPIEQPLVREGDFAVQLAKLLKLTSSNDEAGAETALASADIAPRNGWIADYPVTPDVVAEIRESAAKAAERGKLGISSEKAVDSVQYVSALMGLPVTTAGSPEKIPPQAASEVPYYSDYAYDNSYMEDYYSDMGPPVVTYYPPPWDYYYLYSYVPFPFWWGGFGFGGFFVLNNFHKKIIVKHHNVPVTRTVTNQFASPSGRMQRVNPAARGVPVQGAIVPRGAIVPSPPATAVVGNPRTAPAVPNLAGAGRSTGSVVAAGAAGTLGGLIPPTRSAVSGATNAGRVTGGSAGTTGGSLIPPTRSLSPNRSQAGILGSGRDADRDVSGSWRIPVSPGVSGPLASGASRSSFGSVPQTFRTPSVPSGPGTSTFGALPSRPSMSPGVRSFGALPSRPSMSPGPGSFRGAAGGAIHAPITAGAPSRGSVGGMASFGRSGAGSMAGFARGGGIGGHRGR